MSGNWNKSAHTSSLSVRSFFWIAVVAAASATRRHPPASIGVPTVFAAHVIPWLIICVRIYDAAFLRAQLYIFLTFLRHDSVALPPALPLQHTFMIQTTQPQGRQRASDVGGNVESIKLAPVGQDSLEKFRPNPKDSSDDQKGEVQNPSAAGIENPIEGE